MRNITIAVPDQAIYNTNPDELCLPAAWTDIIFFFSANYLAHAATVRNNPGTRFTPSTLIAFNCLFAPAWGLRNAITQILYFLHLGWR
jgi:hypothetical protein